MATITARKRKSGTRYTAQIRITRKGKDYTDSETFGKRSIAVAWGKRREASMLDDIEAGRGVGRKVSISIGQVLEMYVEDFSAQFGRSKASHIQMLINHPVADLDALELKPRDILKHVIQRRKTVAGSTVNNDLIWLRRAFKSVRLSRDIPLDVSVINDASELCWSEKLVCKPKKRSRRPSIDELNRLLEFFQGRDLRADLQMVNIVLFAMFSARRQEEIVRIEWEYLDRVKKRVLVKDMKHPKYKRDTWVHLPDEAISIIDRMPEVDQKIFPFNGKTVSAAFTRTCKVLAIEDLKFHDLRHECASWLFDMGMDIPRVAMVTGHMSWDTLKRYSHLQGGEPFNKYEDWKWLHVE